MWTVYVLRSVKNGNLYIGLTNNLGRRLREHNRGYNRSTKSKGPFQVIHSETFTTRQKAREREVKLKSGMGREWLKTAECVTIP